MCAIAMLCHVYECVNGKSSHHDAVLRGKRREKERSRDRKQGMLCPARIWSADMLPSLDVLLILHQSSHKRIGSGWGKS